MMPTPIEEQREFSDDALLQMFDYHGWGFFIASMKAERVALTGALLTADPRDAVGVADLQGRIKGLQHVIEFEARWRAETSPEGTGT